MKNGARSAFLTALLAVASVAPGAFAQEKVKASPLPCPHSDSSVSYSCTDTGKGYVHVKSSKGGEWDISAYKDPNRPLTRQDIEPPWWHKHAGLQDAYKAADAAKPVTPKAADPAAAAKPPATKTATEKAPAPSGPPS